MIKEFELYLSKIKDESVKNTTKELLDWVQKKYPTLKPVLKWSQPMFTMDDTFIIGFHASKKHLSITPENDVIIHFQSLIEQYNLEYSTKIIKMNWKNPINYDVITILIDHQMKIKKGRQREHMQMNGYDDGYID